MGPGIIRAGWGGWFDIFFGISGSGSGSLALGGGDGGEGGLRSSFAVPCSSSRWAERSVEKGVLSSRNGFESKCREMRLRRDAGEAREGARLTYWEGEG